MLKICRNGSVLIYSPSKSTCPAQIQRRFISRNGAIGRGLRQEASGGRTERSWEDPSRSKPWENYNKPLERRGKQNSEPPRQRSGKRAPYANRWETRSNQRLQDDDGSPKSYNKQTNEKRPYRREGSDGGNTRSYGDGERKPYQRDQVARGSTQSYGQGEQTGQRRSFTHEPWAERGNKPWKQRYENKAGLADEQKPWGKRPHLRDQTDQDISGRSFGNNNRRAPSSATGAEDAPLGFARPAVGRAQDERRPPQSNSTFRKEYKESKYEAESEPISIPYTTAASEFLYGYNPVRAALKAGRRKLYKIYVHPRVASREDGNDQLHRSIRALAKDAKVEVKDVDDSWLRVMDKMSDYRPHNGVVLEASPLPRLPVISLGPVQMKEDGEERFRLFLSPQSTEERAINGNGSWQSFKSHKWRSPFILLIDDVTNPGNLGAIIRSAYFLGVDAIALSMRTCAPLNADAVKASAGAVEAIPIFRVENVGDFLAKSAADFNTSWNIYAATTPGHVDIPEDRARHSHQQGGLLFTSRSFPVHSKRRVEIKYDEAFRSPLGVDRPVILAIGGEQKGLDREIIRKAWAFVQILPPQERFVDVDVDSLNVSAASAILCAEFMTRSPARLIGQESMESRVQDGPDR